MTKIKTVFEIKEAIRNGEFNPKPVGRLNRLPENHVIDENKSVKWNREAVASLNEVKRSEYNAKREANKKLAEKMESEILKSFASEFNISEAKVELAFRHSLRMSPNIIEALDNLEETLELFEEMNSIE